MNKKRGRKSTTENYFGPEEEQAVNEYLNTKDDAKRHLIYNQILKEPLNKMVESIIRKYKLYRRGETFEDLHSDTLSFLITKADKFQSKLNKKAYSYYGTICKHYILGLLIKDKKNLNQIMSYEDVSSEIEERPDLVYVIDKDEFLMDEFLANLAKGIEKELLEDYPNKKKFNDNERKVGYALLEILKNWEKIFDTMEGGTKYNKNTILETMRNYTNLSTKDIRLAMRRYKELYDILKDSNL